jgi:hypothetical protein
MKRALVVTFGLLMAVALRAQAEDPPPPAKPREGRGFVVGGSLGPGRINFGGAEGLVLVIGESIGTIELGGGQSLDARAGKVVPRALLPVDAEGLIPIPARQNGIALSAQIGWSFSRRLALLFEFDINGGWSDSFNQVNGALALRYSPTPRLWLEAGPAAGDLAYGSAESVAQNVAGAGSGFLVAGGVVLLRKPKLLLDIHVRSGTLWYDQFRATSLSVQLGVMRRRS